MAKKQAAVAESMEDDVTMTDEEEASLHKQTGEAPPEQPPEAPEEPYPKLPEIPAVPKAKRKEEAVPMDRFEQVNERLRQAEQQAAQNQEYRERWARLEERQRLAAEQAQREYQQAEAQRIAQLRPDEKVDPAGARAWDAEQRAMRAEQGIMLLQQQLQQTAQQQQALNTTNELSTWLSFQVPQARARYQDYDTRVDYARAARAAWWASVFQLPDGRQVQLFSPEQARQITAHEEMLLLQRAKEIGVPVADAVVRLSDTWGYPAWAAQQNGQQLQAGNGAVRRAGTPQVMPSGTDRLDNIQRGQAMQGLGRVQSGETNGRLAWESMPNDEFKAFVANMPEDTYLDMIQDPRIGKAFERRVSNIDLTDLA